MTVFTDDDGTNKGGVQGEPTKEGNQQRRGTNKGGILRGEQPTVVPLLGAEGALNLGSLKRRGPRGT